MTLRRATKDEAKLIKTWDEFIGDRRIDTSRGELFVAVEGMDVFGYITYSSNMFANRPFISLLCVKESARRKGVGRALMQCVTALYAGLDVWTSTEEWNTPAIQLFESMGFIQKGGIAGLNSDDSVELYFVLPAEKNTHEMN